MLALLESALLELNVKIVFAGIQGDQGIELVESVLEPVQPAVVPAELVQLSRERTRRLLYCVWSDNMISRKPVLRRADIILRNATNIIQQQQHEGVLPVTTDKENAVRHSQRKRVVNRRLLFDMVTTCKICQNVSELCCSKFWSIYDMTASFL